MNDHQDLDSILKYIHELSKLDNDVPPIDSKASIIDENKIKGFKEGVIFDWKKNFNFPTLRHERSWFWLKMLLLERYHAKQRRLLLLMLSNHTKLDLDSVIWWNRPIILYAVEKIKEDKICEYIVSDKDLGILSMACRAYYLEYGEDVTIWGEALRHFGRNYTEGLSIPKRKIRSKI